MFDARIEENELLKTLEPSVRARFLQRFQRTELDRGQLIHNPGPAPEAVYFLFSGLVAIQTETIDGDSVQTGMIGCDGAVGGFEVFVGGHYFSKGVVQVPGTAVRLSATSFRELTAASAAFRAALERYLETLLLEARQGAVCNALHAVENRLGRAILDAHERSCIKGALPMTQEGLAQVLGAQRTTVAVAMSKLQRTGLIKSRRGAIELRDRAGLERIACSCRKTLKLARAEVQTLRSGPQTLHEGLGADRSPGPAR